MTTANPPSVRPVLLHVKEARAQLRIGNTKFYQLVKRGLIEVVKIDSATRVKTASVDRYIAELPSNVNAGGKTIKPCSFPHK